MMKNPQTKNQTKRNGPLTKILHGKQFSWKKGLKNLHRQKTTPRNTSQTIRHKNKRTFPKIVGQKHSSNELHCFLKMMLTKTRTCKQSIKRKLHAGWRGPLAARLFEETSQGTAAPRGPRTLPTAVGTAPEKQNLHYYSEHQTRTPRGCPALRWSFGRKRTSSPYRRERDRERERERKKERKKERNKQTNNPSALDQKNANHPTHWTSESKALGPLPGGNLRGGALDSNFLLCIEPE